MYFSACGYKYRVKNPNNIGKYTNPKTRYRRHDNGKRSPMLQPRRLRCFGLSDNVPMPAPAPNTTDIQRDKYLANRHHDQARKQTITQYSCTCYDPDDQEILIGDVAGRDTLTHSKEAADSPI